MNRNIVDEDAGALFLCKHWVCSADKFNNTIIDIWKQWEDKGFPIGIPRNVISERYTSIIDQFNSY